MLGYKLMPFRVLFSAICLGAVLLFIFQNVGIIEVRFLFWSVAMSRSLLLFLVLVVGVAIGWLWRNLTFRRNAGHRSVE